MTRARATALALALILGGTAPAAASGLDIRLGAFFPQADSDLFRDAEELYTVGKGDWPGPTGGIEYSRRVGSNVEVGFHLDGYGRSVRTQYRDFVNENGSDIRQRLRLNIVPLGMSVRFLPAGRRSRSRMKLEPYVAIGGDVIFYKYEADGDFVDFVSDDLDIRSDAFLSEGAALGVHGAAGVRVPVSHDVSITGEVKYQYAKTDMAGDFRQNEIDLSGATATLGVHLRF